MNFLEVVKLDLTRIEDTSVAEIFKHKKFKNLKFIECGKTYFVTHELF
jgi:hypothetical protein